MEIQNNQQRAPGVANEPLTTSSNNETLAAMRNPASPFEPKETFLDEAERLLILRRLGVDIETLNAIEQEISELENIDGLSQDEKERLDLLYQQRDELFRAAMERQSGEPLPPGSLVSIST